MEVAILWRTQQSFWYTWRCHIPACFAGRYSVSRFQLFYKQPLKSEESTTPREGKAEHVANVAAKNQLRQQRKKRHTPKAELREQVMESKVNAKLLKLVNQQGGGIMEWLRSYRNPKPSKLKKWQNLWGHDQYDEEQDKESSIDCNLYTLRDMILACELWQLTLCLRFLKWTMAFSSLLQCYLTFATVTIKVYFCDSKQHCNIFFKTLFSQLHWCYVF